MYTPILVSILSLHSSILYLHSMLRSISKASANPLKRHSSLGFLASAPARGMATEQQLKGRIKSVRNIGKITKAMKMVSAAKLRRSQDTLDSVRDFSSAMMNIVPDVVKADGEEGAKKDDSSYFLAAITSDRGLCGGVNSSVTRDIRDKLNPMIKAGEETPFLTIFGDKGRQGLERLFGKYFQYTFSDISRLRLRTFTQSSDLSAYISNAEFNRGDIVYNHFVNLMAFETRTVPLYSYEQFEKDPAILKGYHLLGSREVKKSFFEFYNAVRLHCFLCEADTSELSSRMNAMSNSSKNAEEMLEKLELLYNRTRQAKITTELMEIISGAAAADDDNQDD